MTLTRRDAAATVLTLLAVLVFLATHEGWGVLRSSVTAIAGPQR